MPSFTVEHNTKLSKNEVFEKVQSYFNNSQGLRKLDADLQCTFDEKNLSGHMKGSKFEVQLKISDGNPTKVALTVSIGLLLSPFKGKIQETLKTKMTELLG
jgi:hypothetical protein